MGKKTRSDIGTLVPNLESMEQANKLYNKARKVGWMDLRVGLIMRGKHRGKYVCSGKPPGTNHCVRVTECSFP